MLLNIKKGIIFLILIIILTPIIDILIKRSKIVEGNSTDSFSLEVLGENRNENENIQPDSGYTDADIYEASNETSFAQKNIELTTLEKNFTIPKNLDEITKSAILDTTSINIKSINIQTIFLIIFLLILIAITIIINNYNK